MIREFSAGGLVIRNLSGRPHVAVVPVREEVLALPKGHPEKGESSEDAALREVREETGLEATPVEKLGDIKYWYARDGDRVLKIVSFFLLRYRSGRLEDHDHEVEEALWVPLEEAQDSDDPPRRQGQEVREGRGRDDHGWLPALAAAEDLRRRDRQRRGEAGSGPVAARHRARQPRVPPARRDGPLPRADLRPQGPDGRHRHRRTLLADLRPSLGDPGAHAPRRAGPELDAPPPWPIGTLIARVPAGTRWLRVPIGQHF